MSSSSVAASTHGFLLNGRWIEHGPTAPVRSPYTGEIVGNVVSATRTHAEEAIAGAVQAFEGTRKLPAYERQRILQRVAHEIAARTEDFARLMALEAGKPIKVARGEVGRAIFTFQCAAEESTRIYGEFLPLDASEVGKGRSAIVRRFPLGP